MVRLQFKIKKIFLLMTIFASCFLVLPSNAALMHDATSGDIYATDSLNVNENLDITGTATVDSNFTVDGTTFTINAGTDAINIQAAGHTTFQTGN